METRKRSRVGSYTFAVVASVVCLSTSSFAGTDWLKNQFASQPGAPASYLVPNNTLQCTYAGQPVADCRNRSTDPQRKNQTCSYTVALGSKPVGGCYLGQYCERQADGTGRCREIPAIE